MKSCLLRNTRGTNGRKKQHANFRAFTFMVLFLSCLGIIFMMRKANRTFIHAYIDSQDIYVISDMIPTRTPTPTPTPTPSELQEIVSYITKVFEPEGKDAVKEALEIAFCESGWRKEAYNFNTNNTGDYSLFQINDIHSKRNDGQWKNNWKENVNTAYEIYQEQGWTPWVCAKKLGIN